MDRQLLAEDTEINKLTIIEYLQMAAHGHWTLSILAKRCTSRERETSGALGNAGWIRVYPGGV